MVKDVVRHPFACRTHLTLLLIVARSLVEDIPSKVVSVDFVRGSFAFPIPALFDWRFMPFRVGAERAGGKLWFVCVANRAGRKTCNPCNAFQPQLRFHRTPRLGFGFRGLCDAVTK